MLKEIISNIPITRQFTMPELQENLSRDFVILINETLRIDVTKNSSALTSADMEKIVVVVRQVYAKIFESRVVNPDMKIFVANSLLCRLYELWKISSTPELFFIKIRQAFTPAQIVAALELFMSVLQNQTWALNFFCEHKNIFPRKQKKIRTIAIFWHRMYSGGIERFLSTIIPIYIEIGYRLILITEEYKPELEYPLPPPSSHSFSRIILQTSRQVLKRFNEFEQIFKEYQVDLLISEEVWYVPALQSIFAHLSGIKLLMHFHHELNFHIFDLNRTLMYRLMDGLVNLSEKRKEFWKNYGVRSYYTPLPIYIKGEKNFHGRDPKKFFNTILYTGRVARADDKNTFPIVLILNEVAKVIPNVKLKIVGEIFHEDVFEQMKKFIVENHLEDNVEFCGYHKDVAPFYESADVMLNTSPSEGWSLVIAESKFYELPLVLYELPDSELLRDGKGYVAVPQGDYKAAARAVIKILTDTEFRCKLSAEARESIQPFIDYDFAGAWKKIFDDIENDTPIPPHNVENEKIQTFLLKEIWKQRAQTQAVIAHFQNLMKR